MTSLIGEITKPRPKKKRPSGVSRAHGRTPKQAQAGQHTFEDTILSRKRNARSIKNKIQRAARKVNRQNSK
jgi:hypothetical protein